MPRAIKQRDLTEEQRRWAQFVQQTVHDWRYETKNYAITNQELAEQLQTMSGIDLTPVTFGRWFQGTFPRNLEHLKAFAQLFRVPEEEVFRNAGRSYGSSYQSVLSDMTLLRQHIPQSDKILKLLQYTTTTDWLTSTSTFKRHADYFLRAQTLSLLERAMYIAEMVWAWLYDAKNSTPLLDR